MPIVRNGGESQVTASTTTLLEDGRFFQEPDLAAAEIQDLLDRYPGVLKRYSVEVDGVETSAAEIIFGTASLNNLSARLLVTLLEVKSGLLSNPTPAPDQVDRALRYVGDENLGFAAQLSRAAYDLITGLGAPPPATAAALRRWLESCQPVDRQRIERRRDPG